jgi:hypothetical protein
MTDLPPTEPAALSDPAAASHPDATALTAELDSLLAQSKGQLGEVARTMQTGVTDRQDLLEQTGVANSGALSNLLVYIDAIREGTISMSPSRAQQALSATRSFLRQHRDRMSDEAVAHVDGVIERLEQSANDREAQEKEDEELISHSDALEQSLADAGGVYVYTYPHYWRFRTVDDSNRTLLKIGMSNVDTGERVRQQARQAAVPEDPILLRVYRSATKPPLELERDFHRLLRAADHVRETKPRIGGTEWFETSIEFLDTVADVLKLQILRLGDDSSE